MYVVRSIRMEQEKTSVTLFMLSCDQMVVSDFAIWLSCVVGPTVPWHAPRCMYCVCFPSWLQSPEIRANTPTALMATATSPLTVNVSAMTDGRGLDVTTEMEVGWVVYAFQDCTEVCTMFIHVGSCVFVYVRTTYYVTEHSTYTCTCTCVYSIYSSSTYIHTYLAVLAVVVVVHNVPLSH